MVTLKQIWMWLSLREVCTWCTCILWHFSNNYTDWILTFFSPLTTISGNTSNCTSARVGEQQVSGALTPDLPHTFFMNRHCYSKSHPSSSLVDARERLLQGCKAAPCSTASWILARPISHGLWPNRIQVTGREWLTVGGLIGLFKSSQPDSLYPFRCT